MLHPETLLEQLRAAPAETMAALRAADDGAPILGALALASEPRARALLCDALGFRKQASAVDALIACLADDSARVRSSAADALAKIGDPRAGAALLRSAALPDPDAGARRMQVAALGAVGHQPAVPLLTALLGDADPSLRGSAAWSLGALRAASAEPALRQALQVELAPYPAERMRAALAALASAPR